MKSRYIRDFFISVNKHSVQGPNKPGILNRDISKDMDFSIFPC